MLPTIANEGDYVFVEKISVPLGLIRRGDIVVSTSPIEPNKLLCKRVLSMVNIMFVRLSLIIIIG